MGTLSLLPLKPRTAASYGTDVSLRMLSLAPFTPSQRLVVNTFSGATVTQRLRISNNNRNHRWEFALLPAALVSFGLAFVAEPMVYQRPWEWVALGLRASPF